MARIRFGFMCGTDYDHYLAGSDGSNQQTGAALPVEIYSDQSLLEDARPCVKDKHNPCSILRVEVREIRRN